MTTPRRTGPPALYTDPGRLAQCVTDLGAAIARGAVTPTALELDALAIVCDENHLPAEAGQVRSWMRPA